MACEAEPLREVGETVSGRKDQTLLNDERPFKPEAEARIESRNQNLQNHSNREQLSHKDEDVHVQRKIWRLDGGRLEVGPRALFLRNGCGQCIIFYIHSPHASDIHTHVATLITLLLHPRPRGH